MSEKNSLNYKRKIEKQKILLKYWNDDDFTIFVKLKKCVIKQSQNIRRIYIFFSKAIVIVTQLMTGRKIINPKAF